MREHRGTSVQVLAPLVIDFMARYPQLRVELMLLDRVIDLLEEGGFDEGKSYQGRRVSLDFKDAPLKDVVEFRPGFPAW